MDSGFLLPVFVGVYLVGRPGLSMDSLRMAAVLAAGRGAVLGGRAAADVWGFMNHVSPLDVHRLSGAINRRSQMKVDGFGGWPYLLVHRPVALPSSEVGDLKGIPVTSVARTLWDLAGQTSAAKFNQAFIKADLLGLIDDDDLAERASRVSGHRGGRAFRKRCMARVPDIDRARSVLEAIYLDLRQKGLVPEAELNVPVLGYEADLMWRDRGVIVELDGYEFHRGREAFENDALRGNRLKAHGWSVLRVTWRMLNGRPKEVSDLIQGVLAHQPIANLPK
ncbi:MAG: endonuclease domain-containing protein [Solirubrobacterales bacterium]